jgi:hypothetical protein
MSRIRIATRKSELALWQANHVADLLRAAHPGIEVELLPMVTRGDIILDQPLARIGGKGLFLKELERALLRDEADIAVHSMKDVPVEEVPGLIVEVMLARANPYDAWLSRDGHASERAACGASVSSARCAPIFRFWTCGATSIRGFESWTKASMTPLFWPAPDSNAWGWAGASARCSSRPGGCRRRPRERSVCSAVRGTIRSWNGSPCSTTTMP